jgi:putative endonuclease
MEDSKATVHGFWITVAATNSVAPCLTRGPAFYSKEAQKMAKGGWVYIMADRYRGGLYVGVTSNLTRRIHQHKNGEGSIHVAKYGIVRLVYAERHEEIESAITREKLIKKWQRPWKFALIEADNPDWRDLWDEWFAANPEQK